MIDNFKSIEDNRDPLRNFLRFLDEEHKDFLELINRPDFVEKILYVKATLDSIIRLLEASAEHLLDLKSYLDAQGLPIYSAMTKTYVSEIKELNDRVGEIIKNLDEYWLNKEDELGEDRDDEIYE